MAKARSPEYPSLGLKEAIEKVKLVYDKDYQNKLPKAVMATHMGYKGLNGTSLPALSALSKYGLIEGRGDETRVSDLGLAIVAHGPGTPERIQALRTAASTPELFAELDAKFQGGKASDAALRSYLLTEHFIPTAADTAIRSYRETKQLVEAESGGYVEPQQESPMTQTLPVENDGGRGFQAYKQMGSQLPQARLPVAGDGVLQEVFNLDEGPVTLTFPAKMSAASYEDLEAHLQIFLRKAKRRADAIRQFNVDSGDPDMNEVG